jgi:DNA-binding NarL/FixJ family response regulator
VTPTARILIIDDHPIFRTGIAQLINHQGEFFVCGEAETAPEALEAIVRLKPDLVILDITLKGINGIELMKTIRSSAPQLPVLVLSMHEESLYAERALRAGARGYVTKQEASNQVLDAIRRVLTGELYVSPVLGLHIATRMANGGDWAKSAVENLTDRELEIFELLGRGRGTRQIAVALKLSVKTVETHRAHIKAKLGAKTAPEMVRLAVQWVNELPNSNDKRLESNDL